MHTLVHGLFSLQVHVDQYGDCSSSHRVKENLSCGKFGVESFAVSVVLIHGIFAVALEVASNA